jgi:3-deoxy-D-manno-octulosonate 8-phosphate phosphatase (KDO 8-P phosphatase)
MKKNNPKIFIIDVDGVMTDGKFYYSEKGKVLKCFGPDDNDALKLLNSRIAIQFVTGDKKGFKITKKRITDMRFKVKLVSTIKRLEWVKENFNLSEVIYMGDGIFDHYTMKEVGYSISPANADDNCKKYANFITKRNGGDRAVSEACLHILKKFFKTYSHKENIPSNIKFSGGWNS